MSHPAGDAENGLAAGCAAARGPKSPSCYWTAAQTGPTWPIDGKSPLFGGRGGGAHHAGYEKPFHRGTEENQW